MFRKLIIATDLSEASVAVIERAADLRSQGAEDCLLLLCLGFQEASSLYSISDTAYIDKKLNRQKEMLQKYGYKVDARVVPGFARQEISRIVKEEDYSLVVSGSRKHTLFGEKLMENLAFEIIHHVSHPVLIVRLKEQKTGEEVEIVPQASDLTGHVLHPTDFSENADRAFSYVEKMVEAGVKRVSLLHVQNSSMIESRLTERFEEFNRKDLSRLEQMKKRLLEKGNAEVTVSVAYGSPYKEISIYIKEKEVSLTVMGSQGVGFLEEIVTGSISHKIVRHGDSSVLLVPVA